MRGTPRPFRLARADTHGHTHTCAPHLGLSTLGWVGPAFRFFHGPAVVCARVRVPRIDSSHEITSYWV